MITDRRVALVATCFAALTLLLASCGSDDGAKPQPPPPQGPAFAWHNPTPTGDAIRGIWGSSAFNVTAVGDAGTVMRYNGSTWRVLDIRLGSDVLWDIWGAAANDIWVVGDNGRIWRFNGSNWAESASPTTNRLRAVHGLGTDLAYAVGDGGVVVEWDGSSWSTVPQPLTTATLLDAFIISTPGAPNTLFVVTDDPVRPLIRYNGTAWSVDAMPSMNAQAVWVNELDDLFVVGSVGTIARKNGTKWEFSYPGGTETLFDVFGFASSPTSAAFAVGTNSTILEFDGSDWSPVAVSGAFPLFSVWGTDADNVNALGSSGGLYTKKSGVWSQSSTSVTTTTLCGMTAFGSSRYACGGAGTVVVNTGSGWSKMTSNTTADLNSIYAIAANSVYAVGVGGEIIHYNGTNWSTMTSNVAQDLTGVWGLSDTSVVAVGADDPIQFDGSNWSPMPAAVNASGLLAVWGSGEDDIYGVGRNGMILRYEGSSWASVPSPVTTTLRAASGSAADEIYAAGDNGRVIYYDGSSWTDVMGGAFQVDLYGVAISSSHGVFAVGDLGAICFLTESENGASFSAAKLLAQEWVELPFTNQSQRSAAVDGSGNVFFGGAGGTIIRFGQ